MKIRTQVIISIVFFGIALLLISGAVITTSQQIDRLKVQETVARDAALQANELSYLSSDFIMYREGQQAMRWNTRYAALAEDLAKLQVDDPNEQVLVNNLRANQIRLREVFDDISSSSTRGGSPLDPVALQVSWSRLAVQNQGIIFDAERLAQEMRDREDRLEETTNLLIFVLLGLFSIFLLSNYLLFYRRTLKSIASLSEGTKIIGEGNLDHQVTDGTNDEIGELSDAFNRMTRSLKEITASKADLETEIGERKRAEEELRRKNEELEVLNEELTSTQEELQQNVDELVIAGNNLRESETRFRSLFDSMSEAFAVHEMIFDAEGKPYDYRWLSANPAFERTTGIVPATIIGKTVREVMPDIEEVFIEMYGKVVLTGEPAHFEQANKATGRFYNVIAYRPEPGRFAVVFTDITERRKNEEALRKTHEELENHIANSPLAVVEFDAQERITRWEGDAGRMFGWSAEEVVGKAPGDFRWIFEEDAGRVAAITADMLSGKSTRTMYDTRNYRKDGTVIFCEWYNSAVRDENGNLVSVLSQVLDVTGRTLAEADIKAKNALLNDANDELRVIHEELQRKVDEIAMSEHALRLTTQYLENLITYANAPIIVWDKDLRITRFNRAFEELTGRSAEGVVGRKLDILFPPSRKMELMDLIYRTLTGEHWENVEIPIQTVKSGVRTVLWNSASLYDTDEEKVSSVIAQGQDITERKIAEAKNIEAREEWERTFNTVPDLIAVLDKNHRIIRVNKAMADRMKTTPDKCIGISCHEVIHGTGIPPDFCPHAATCRDGKQHTAEVHEPNLGGDFLVSTTPLFDAAGKLMGTVHVARDITERKRMETELLRRNEELAATQEELQQNIDELAKREADLRNNETKLQDTIAEKEILLSEIHHRVKNNLAAFISLLSLEGSYEETPEGQNLKKDLQNRARSMALIHETLYRTGKYSGVDMGVYLSTLLDQIAGSYASAKTITIVVEAEGVVIDIARATPCGLIINELVTNSFKYAFPPSFDCAAIRHEPCTIRISLEKKEGSYFLVVQDNGVGLPPGFDPGTAPSLGLKLVNFLARHQLRAKIVVDTTEGTRYSIQFKDTIR